MVKLLCSLLTLATQVTHCTDLLLSSSTHWLHCCLYATTVKKVKVKASPYWIPSVWRRADLGVQAVSPQVTMSHPPGGRLPLISARPAVTFPAAEHHRPLAGSKLYCLVTVLSLRTSSVWYGFCGPLVFRCHGKFFGDEIWYTSNL